MKTLDEVIEEVERCWNNITDGCGKCPEFRKCFFCVSKNPTNDPLADALHYLKEYRNCGQCSYADSYLRCTQEYRNDPLTWEDLCLMVGKPVWIEYDDHGKGRKRTHFKEWDVIDFLSDGDMCMLSNWTFEKDELGKTWQAYRKERK